MRFGPLELDAARGALLAHTTRLPGRTLKKGLRLTDEALRALRAAGRTHVVAAVLEEGDVDEDAAAAELARVLAGDGLHLGRATTGRCNLYAARAALLRVSREIVDTANGVDESLTVATLSPGRVVALGAMVATVKVIPFSVPEERVRRAVAACAAAGGAIRVDALGSHAAGVILTELPGLPEKLLTRASTSLRTRLERLGSRVAREIRCPHETPAVAQALEALLAAGCSPILMLGASAIVDRCDTLPAAVEASGGSIVHLGLPVDPGNLLLLAEHGGTPVIGVPGCARSTKPSGFDWVLERTLAGERLGGRDLVTMGVGGLLLETPSRPAPREGGASRIGSELADAEPPRIAAVVLAAGRSQRMGDVNKLLHEIDGQPMVVVTGHESPEIRAALGDRKVAFAHNPDFALGMSTSLRVGLRALDEGFEAALVCLADMPWLGPAHLDALIDAFDPDDDRGIYVPVHNRKRGNPVLWHRRYFEEMATLSGDRGARSLLDHHVDEVCYVPLSNDAINIDFDTPDALRELRRPEDRGEAEPDAKASVDRDSR
jgi:molybdenum cofactor cytidylyltransferase